MNNESKHSLTKVFNFLVNCISSRRQLFWQIFFLVIIFNVTDILLIKFLQYYIDAVAGKVISIIGFQWKYLLNPRNQIIFFSVVMFFLAIFRYGISYFRAIAQAKLGQGIILDLRCRIYDTMQSLSFAYHDTTHRGRLIANVVEDIGHTARFFEIGIFPLVENTLYLFFAWIAMSFICWPVALASLGGTLLSSIGVYCYFKWGFALCCRCRIGLERVVEFFSESMEGNDIIRSFGCHQIRKEEYKKNVFALHNVEIKERFLFSFLNQILLFPAVLLIVATVAIPFYLNSYGWGISGGQIFFLFSLQNLLVGRVRVLSRMVERMLQFSVSVTRLEKLFKEDSILASGNESAKKEELSLKAVNLTFGYNPKSPVISKVNIFANQGETIAFVGEAGAGKSTIALLLCRFYDPSSGFIMLGEKKIKDISVKEIRSRFALVFQDTFLFSTTIRENISYGRPDAKDEEIVHAATHANAHDFIMSFPDGYDTVVGEKGVTLSGGEKQRISIARALLRKPDFLILDDCTSALDVNTERDIQAALRELSPKTIKIIIAHRFSSIAHADRVYVLVKGEIVEIGNPHELKKSGTVFSKILQIGDVHE